MMTSVGSPPKARASWLTPALLAVVAAGCAKQEDIRACMVYDTQIGAYDRAIVRANELYDCVLKGELAETDDKSPAEKDDISSKNELLWRMERGGIEVARARYATSLPHLERASDLVIERRTESLARKTATFIANDTASEYAGNGYEHVQVDFLRALGYVVAAQRLQGIMPQGGEKSEGDLDLLVQKMNNTARGMVLDKIQFHQDVNTGLRYYDDPFARVFAAAMVLATPPNLRAADDEGFAMAMLTKALRAYREQQKVLGAAKGLRYEVQGIPAAALRLAKVVGSSYDPEGLQQLLESVQVAPDDPALGQPLGKEEGLVFVLHLVDWITPTDELQIDLKINVPYVPAITPAEQARGVTVTGFMTFGGTTFYAKGPNSELIREWGGAIAITGELARIFGVADPGTWIGFELPWHRADRSIPPPGKARVGSLEMPLEVQADIDAYARVTLKDNFPSIMTKTMGRVFAKHLAAIVARKAMEASAMRQEDGSKRLMGLLMAKLLGTTTHAAATASENADTRHWATLYDRIEGALITVPAGEYSVSLSTSRASYDLGTVKVPAGRLVCVPVRSISTPMPNPYPPGAPEAQPPASSASASK
ncbi:MAG: hypothetical protein RMM29_05045 [Planctomycetota bacterium]|nr:hypothetical protein [Planctomycetota bacterium]